MRPLANPILGTASMPSSRIFLTQPGTPSTGTPEREKIEHGVTNFWSQPDQYDQSHLESIFWHLFIKQ